MKSSHACYQEAEKCERRGAQCQAAVLRDQWLDMAGEWRRLGDDGNARGTLARLMSVARRH